MRISSVNKAALRNRYRCLAFTLPGLQVAAVIFLIVIAAALSVHIFGIKMMQVVEANQGVGPRTKIHFKRLELELKDATKVQVGSWDGRTFLEPDADARQGGNALLIYTNSDAKVFIRYHWDKVSKSLIRQVSNESIPKTIAADIGNSEVFTVEDAFGNVLSNLPGSRIIGVRLQFTKVETGTAVGKGEHFESFELKTKVAFQAW